MNKGVGANSGESVLTRRVFLLACLGMLAVVPHEAEAQQLRRAIRRRRRRLRRQNRLQNRRAREALRRGEIKPLFQLIKKFEASTGGEVLDARYRERGTVRVYIFDTLFPDGRIARYVMDAGSGEIYTFAEAIKHYGIEPRR